MSTPSTSSSSRSWRWRWRSWPRCILPGARRARHRRRRCGMSKDRDSGFGIRDSEGQVQQQPHVHDGEVIRAEGLAKTYAEGSLRTPVFDGLDLAVHAGETVAIVGGSGAGTCPRPPLLGGPDPPPAAEEL